MPCFDDKTYRMKFDGRKGGRLGWNFAGSRDQFARGRVFSVYAGNRCDQPGQCSHLAPLQQCMIDSCWVVRLEAAQPIRQILAQRQGCQASMPPAFKLIVENPVIGQILGNRCLRIFSYEGLRHLLHPFGRM